MSDESVVAQNPEQERRAAEAAFAVASEDAPTEAAPEVAEVKAEEKPAKPVEATPDPWLGVPDVVKTTLEGINGKLGAFDALRNDMKAGLGRIGSIQSELAAAKASAKTTNEAPTQSQIEEASHSLESWNTLKEEFKEWSDGIDERIAERIAADRADVIKRIPNVDSLATQEQLNQAKNEGRQLARLDAKHENWEEEVNTPAFKDWHKQQPQEVQALAESDSARDAIKMLDLYVDHKKVVEKREKDRQRLEAAIPARGTPGPRQQTPSDREAAEKAFASA